MFGNPYPFLGRSYGGHTPTWSSSQTTTVVAPSIREACRGLATIGAPCPLAPGLFVSEVTATPTESKPSQFRVEVTYRPEPAQWLPRGTRFPFAPFDDGIRSRYTLPPRVSCTRRLVDIGLWVSFSFAFWARVAAWLALGI